MGEQQVSLLGLAVPLALTVLVVVVAVRRTRSEPRRLSNAYWLMIAAMMVIGSAVLLFPNGGLILLPFFLLAVLSPILILVLAVFLILNGVVLLRRESLSLAHLLSLAAGLGMLLLLVLTVPVFLSMNRWLTFAFTVTVLAASYLGFQFLSFVGYSLLYRRIVRDRPADWVIVLGSGLGADGQVPPLLAARIRTGVSEFERSGAWKLIMSGGRGDDEIRSEASAMAEWAVDHGTRPDVLALEEQSRNTEQNLRYSAELVPTRDIASAATPGLLVTSNYHVLRAAILARKVGLPAQAYGAPTAGYYWPSAMLREFLAILAERPVLHGILIAVIALPLPTLITLVGL